MLPQIIMLGSESLPALSTRSKTNRGNAYIRPDAGARPGRTFILPSFDCNNSGEKGPTNTPGCRVQGQVPFEGLSQRFPQVQPGLPGGRLKSLRRLSGGLPRMTVRVGVVGHVEWVQFAVVDRVPAAGEIVHARETFAEPAGGGAVAAVQLARLAGSALFLTALGNDDAAAGAERALRERFGVDVHAAARRQPAAAHASRSSTTPASGRSRSSASGSCRCAPTRCRGTRSPSSTGST